MLSGAPDGDCSIADLANDVISVLDDISVKKVHFVGLSIGGIIGQALAISYPERLLSLVLSDTNVASAPGAEEMWRARIATVKEAKSAVPLAAGMMGRLLTEKFKHTHPLLWQQIYQTICATQPEGVYACAQALLQFDYSVGLRSVTLPTLVLCGQNDPATPPTEAMKIVGLVNGSTYREIPGALHFPNVECSEEYSDILLEWLRRR